MAYTGFFELLTPRDLLAKAKRDFERLRKNPLNVDAAFDFCVTARHVPDWMEAKNLGTASVIFDQFVELRICRHLADGAKHFEAKRKMHKQVQGAEVSSGGFQADAFQPDASQTGRLEIKLDPNDADTLELGESIDAISLGKKVIEVLDEIVP